MNAPAAIPVTEGSHGGLHADTGSFVVSELFFDGGVTLAPHEHERACLSFLAGGTMLKAFTPRRYTLESPSLITIPPGERHADWFGQRGTHIVVVEIEPEFAAQQPIMKPGVDLLYDVVERRNEQVASFAKRIARELQAPDDFSPLALNGLVFELLTTLGRPEDVLARTSRRLPPWVSTVVEFLHTNTSQHVAIEDIAKVVDLHPGYLARTFRQHMGVPLGAFARDVRLDRVAERLAHTNARILDIALDAGFADQSHLTRSFRKRFGMTPGEYRANRS
jgi:AraC-like DNA-binding protein